MKKSNRRISDLFYNNRFLLVFSIVCAVLIWLVVAVEFGEEIETSFERTVSAQPTASRLEPFGEKEFNIRVVVRGKKYIVDSKETRDNIKIVLDTGNVKNAGKESVLTVAVTSKDVDIVDWYPKTVSVFYDTKADKDLPIEKEEYLLGELAEVGYKVLEPELVNEYSVNITGPASEIREINRVVAKASPKGDLRETQTLNAELVFMRADGGEIVYSEPNIKSVQLRLPVYKIEDLVPLCSFSNPPVAYIDNPPFEYVISPKRVTVGVTEEQFRERDSFELSEKIDYSELHEGVNNLKLSADSSEVYYWEEKSFNEPVKEFTVTVNVQGMSRKTIDVPESVNVNIPDNIPIELAGIGFSEIVIIGPAEELAALNSDNLVFTADFSGIDTSEKGKTITVPLKLFNEKCWIYGTYNATFIVK